MILAGDFYTILNPVVEADSIRAVLEINPDHAFPGAAGSARRLYDADSEGIAGNSYGQIFTDAYGFGFEIFISDRPR
jgi:hypothetical protein